MRRLIKPFFWSLVFIVLLITVDQMLVQVPPLHPAHATVVRFYKDFRARLLGMPFEPTPAQPAQPTQSAKPAAPESIEAVIGKEQTKALTPAQPTQRYVYADEKGELQFADSLDAVPHKYRSTAEPLGE